MIRAFIFPGQGAQFCGMGKALYEGNSGAKSLMEDANDILGFRITDTMFTGSDEDLKQTKVTQPAIFLMSVALARFSSELDKPDMVAGHSLGEFSALTVAGALSFEDALRLVSVRAEAMQKCCESVPGTMAAIIGLDNDTVDSICNSTEGIVVPANYNSDGQVVISGSKDAVQKACSALKEAGARRALPLNVGGAFHSPLMEPARTELAMAIQKVIVSEPFCPIYQNVTARPCINPEEIKNNLLSQLTSSVKWTQSIKNMLSDGATSFTEIGPGSVLQGLVKRIAAGTEGVEINGIQ